MKEDAKDSIIDLDNMEGEDRYYYCLDCGFLIGKRNFDTLSFLFPYDPCSEKHLCPKCRQPFKRTIKKKKAITLIKKKKGKLHKLPL